MITLMSISRTSRDGAQPPWNKEKLTGARPPLRPKHVWSIRTKLQVEQRTRDLAMFNLAIDSKLRGCDLVALKVEDIAPNGYSLDRATVRLDRGFERCRCKEAGQGDAGQTARTICLEAQARPGRPSCFVPRGTADHQGNSRRHENEATAGPICYCVASSSDFPLAVPPTFLRV